MTSGHGRAGLFFDFPEISHHIKGGNMSQALTDASIGSKRKSTAIRIAVKAGIVLAALGGILVLTIRLTESMGM